MRHVFRLCASSFLLLVSSAAFAQAPVIVADDATSAKAFRSQVGKIVTFVCPSKLNTIREIWGTDVYMDESPICTAAVHAEVFTPSASVQVTIVMGPGAESLEGTGRNGVSSDPNPSSGWQPLGGKTGFASLQVSPLPFPIKGTLKAHSHGNAQARCRSRKSDRGVSVC